MILVDNWQEYFNLLYHSLILENVGGEPVI